MHHQNQLRGRGREGCLAFGLFGSISLKIQEQGSSGEATSRLPPLPMIPRSSYGVHKLVHQSLRHHGLADDALLVVLADGAAQLVVVHGRPVLLHAPQPRHLTGTGTEGMVGGA